MPTEKVRTAIQARWTLTANFHHLTGFYFMTLMRRVVCGAKWAFLAFFFLLFLRFSNLVITRLMALKKKKKTAG